MVRNAVYDAIGKLEKIGCIDELAFLLPTKPGQRENRPINIAIIISDQAKAYHLDERELPYGLVDQVEEELRVISERSKVSFSTDYYWKSDFEEVKQELKKIGKETKPSVPSFMRSA